MASNLFKKAAGTAVWILPAVLLWASFPPFGEAIDSFFALAPLMYLSRRASVRRNFKAWFGCGILFWLATLHWLVAIVKNGGPLALVILGLVFLSLYCAAYFALYGYLSSWCWQAIRESKASARARYGWRLAMIVVVEPVLWMGLELVRSRFAGGFAWNQLGVGAVNAGMGAPAIFGGVYLVSGLVILINGIVASVFERMFHPDEWGVSRSVRILESALPFCLVVAVFMLSSAEQDSRDQSEKEKSASTRAILLQRNFPSVFNRERKEDPVEMYRTLLAAAKHVKADMAIAAESALGEFGLIGARRSQSFAQFVLEETGVKDFIAGGTRIERDKEYNSAVQYSSDGARQVYDKVHLVPFGEYIPGDKTIKILQKLAPVGSCTPGKLQCLINSAGVKYGVGICFEDTDSAQQRKLAAMGARFLVFITNDSWFSYSCEAEQHAWQAVARAIETGLPILRVGNSGVTGVIDAHGARRWLKDENGKVLVDRSAAMADEIVYGVDGKPTPYVIFGDKPLFFLFLLLITVINVIKYKNEHEK